VSDIPEEEAMSATVSTSVRTAGRKVQGDWKDTLGRVGLVGKGVLFAVIGVLAIQLATGDAANASKSGAVQWVASQPFGKFLLVALTVSLFALAAWRLLDAWLGDPVEGSEAKDRVKYLVSGVLYLVLAGTALTVTIANWSGGASSGAGSASGSGGSDTQQQATGVVLDWPAGQWLVALAGIAVIGYAAYQVKKNVVDARFTERLEVGETHWAVRLGRVGYGARTVVYAVIGWLLVQAAVTYDPAKTAGLSGALKELAGNGIGQVVLWVVAFGLLGFGAFCVAEAKLRKAA
jgi:hypothetical protein